MELESKCSPLRHQQSLCAQGRLAKCGSDTLVRQKLTPQSILDSCKATSRYASLLQECPTAHGYTVVAMKSVIVGTAGHIDHGKTSLVKALTGIDADRLEEEKRRGITIDIGFAHLELPAPNGDKLRLGFVDVPGHERFVRNMLAGVGGIDLVLLVIAADEGIKPQTREHFDIC